jgi:predicted nucleotidyltransferase
MTETSQRRAAIDIEVARNLLASARLLPQDALAAFFVGSAARGWMTPASDVDIYIVTADLFRPEDGAALAVPLQPDVVWTRLAYLDERRWEIKYWTESQVGQILEKVSRASFESEETATSLTLPEEAFLERVLSCIPLSGEQWVLDQREVVQASAFREIIVSRSLGEADKAAENALGQLAMGDPQGAALAAHGAMRYTVDALLDSIGCHGSISPKWRVRRVREASPAALPFDRYWAMETMQDLDRADPEPWVHSTLSWCREMAMEIEV